MLTQGPTLEEERIVSAHFTYLKDLAEQGIVLLAGRTLNTDESSFGIVIMEEQTRNRYEAILPVSRQSTT